MTTKWEINKAVRASGLPAPSRLIMLVLSDIAEAGTAEIPEQYTPSLRVLAEETGLDRATIKRHLAGLETAGWVERSRPTIEAARREGERTCYKLTLPVGADSATLGAQDTPLGAGSAKTMAHSAPTHGAESAHPRRTVRHIEEEPDLFQISPDLLPDHSSSAPPPKKRGRKRKQPPGDPTQDAAFMHWYEEIYPKHVARPDAYAAYLKAITKISAADLDAKTEAWVKAELANGTALTYFPHPATWLNRERWNDRLTNTSRASPGKHKPYQNPEDDSIYEGKL